VIHDDIIEPRTGSVTPIWNLPYPSASDPVSEGAANFQALATATETALSFGKLFSKTTPKDVTTTAAETDVLNGEGVIPAGVLRTNRALLMQLSGDMLYNNAGTDSARLRFKFGPTTVWDSGNMTNATGGLTTDARRYAWFLQILIQNLAANSQLFSFTMQMTRGAAAPAVGTGGAAWNQAGEVVGWNAAAVDTTVAQVFQMTWQWGVVSANDSFRLQQAIGSVIP
jgi:hypothetical protein